MGLTAFAAIVVVSLAAGVAVQIFGAKKSPYDFLIVGLTAIFGATFASNNFPGSSVFGVFKDFGPAVDGFYLIPGVALGLGMAVVAYVGTRETYSASRDLA
ncbi:MAG TPA: hypothetical protein VGT60_02520 [Candidatus Limnocylindria bacterium]|nr:hypothetical protein [Candidatus Limnocylindria bacterium]